MGFFSKKTEKCCCGTSADGGMYNQEPPIKILGSGCPKCISLEKAVKDALQELGSSEEVGHVTDFSKIAEYGVMSTPALVVDGKVVSYSKVLTKEEAKTLIRKTRG